MCGLGVEGLGVCYGPRLGEVCGRVVFAGQGLSLFRADPPSPLLEYFGYTLNPIKPGSYCHAQ